VNRPRACAADSLAVINVSASCAIAKQTRLRITCLTELPSLRTLRSMIAIALRMSAKSNRCASRRIPDQNAKNACQPSDLALRDDG
jgi:hypothetical protein